jgi:hypothetical protein
VSFRVLETKRKNSRIGHLKKTEETGIMSGITVNNKSERVFQIYNWFKTARLNVLYYEESLRNWKLAVRVHDILIGLSGDSSPIAF